MRATTWTRPKTKVSWNLKSTPTPGRGRVIRQSASAPTRRKITVNDVFALLLTPVLATALIADTSWKDKRRKDWANKIAEVEAETVRIQARALQSWQALQSRSLSLGAAQQRRQYSATALKSQLWNEETLPPDNASYGRHVPLEEADYEPQWFESSKKKIKDPAFSSHDEAEQEDRSYTPEMLKRSDRLRRLLAIKLALNMTIYLNTGVSASKLRKEIRIPDWSDEFQYDGNRCQDLRGLLKRMENICSTLAHLKETLPDGASPVRQANLSSDSQRLQDEICDLSDRFQTSSIAMPEFVSSYTLAVLKSPVPPTSKTYLALFRGFSRGSGHGFERSHDLAMQTLFAWEQSRLPIDDHDMFVILTELARLKHVQKFDGLMRDLTMSPSPLNVTDKWTWERANDIQVPIPKSYNPATLVTLIHCALRFDQPHKAEAWSEILRRTWIDVNDPTQKTPLQRVFTNWMRYWEVQGNWRKGITWLDAAQKWAITVASFDLYSLQRLAVGMLSLCFACGKTQEYEEILNAAIDAGIPSIHPEHFLERSARRAICQEWGFLYGEAYRDRKDMRTDQEKVENFQGKVRDFARRFLPEKQSADIEWRHEQDNKANPMSSGLGIRTSDRTLPENNDIWKQLYYKNQEAIQDAKAAAENWRKQYVRKQKEVAKQQKAVTILKRRLELQQDQVRKVAELRTRSTMNETDSPHAKVSINHDFLESLDGVSFLGLQEPEFEAIDNRKVSRLGSYRIEMKQEKSDISIDGIRSSYDGVERAYHEIPSLTR